MRKKILIVRHSYGNSDFKAYNIQEMGLGKAFCRLGYDFDYVSYNTNPHPDWIFYEDPNGCKCRYIEKPRIRFMRWAINKQVASKEFLSQYDIVISREYYQIMTYLMACNHNNVYLYNGPYWNMFMLKFVEPIYDFFITKRIIKKIKGTFVKSGMSKQFLEDKGYTDVVNIGVGLDMQRFDDNVILQKETADLIDYMSSNKCILYIGHLDANKNLPFMLKLYQSLLVEIPDLKFVMIGKSVISACSKLLGKKDEDYAVEEFSKLPENVRAGIKHIKRVENSQLKYIYPKAKAFVLPSKLEIFGMVLAEAMYLGAPVVTSKNGGSTSLIEGRETGIMIDDYNIIRWKDAVLRLIRDEAYSAKLKENAKNVINSEYNWDSIAKRMLDIIENK